jgi:CHAD domain-containing protein
VKLLTARGSNYLTDSAVHEIRVRIKKNRALLRLVRAELGEDRYASVKRHLQQTGGSLASARDAKVTLAAGEHLLQHLDPTDRAVFCVTLRNRLSVARRKLSPAARRKLARKLAAVQEQLADWAACDTGWKTLARELRHEYASGCDAFESARAAPTEARVHELRKRSKTLLYMCDFLRTMSPYASARLTQLNRFAAFLGTDHDLSILKRAVPSRHLRRMARRKQIALRKSAWQLGAGIYGESTAHFTRHVHRDWKQHNGAGRL